MDYKEEGKSDFLLGLDVLVSQYAGIMIDRFRSMTTVGERQQSTQSCPSSKAKFG